MFNNNNNSKIKATIKSIIVAFMYIAIFFAIAYVLFSDTISRAISLIDMISVDTNKKILQDVKFDLEAKNSETNSETNSTTKSLTNYPEYRY